MPIYEYTCDSCEYEGEKIQKISDAPLRECPACGALTLRRLVSAAGFRLQGGGWYETDFKKKATGTTDSKGAGAGDKAAHSEATSKETSGEGGSTSSTESTSSKAE